jgi:putative tryptophan/tyrosine transport system substrate-binding protein
MSGMGRREFVALVGGAVAAWPLAARAQQQPMPTIGFLSGISRSPVVDDFLRGLKESGFVEGQNVAIEYRFASGQYDKLPGLAAELVDKKVALIATFGENAAKAAQAASGSIVPIVVALGDDPVSLGLVTSLNRPGGISPARSASATRSDQSASSCCASSYPGPARSLF